MRVQNASTLHLEMGRAAQDAYSLSFLKLGLHLGETTDLPCLVTHTYTSVFQALGSCLPQRVVFWLSSSTWTNEIKTYLHSGSFASHFSIFWKRWDKELNFLSCDLVRLEGPTKSHFEYHTLPTLRSPAALSAWRFYGLPSSA